MMQRCGVRNACRTSHVSGRSYAQVSHPSMPFAAGLAKSFKHQPGHKCRLHYALLPLELTLALLIP